jgi:hypothetical protein
VTLYKIYLTNFDRFSEWEFFSLEDAAVAAKKICFECSIHHGQRLVAVWSPLNGLSLVH